MNEQFEKIEAADARRGDRLRLSPEDVRGKQQALEELMQLASDYRAG